MDLVPGVSQVKSIVQTFTGDPIGALKTQKNFINQCPIVSQGTSIVHLLKGDKKAALETQKSFLNTVNGFADGIPIVGHIKGGIHYATGNKEAGDNSMKSASRTAGVMGGGVAGFLAAGPAGSVIGGMQGGLAMDLITTKIDSTIHKEHRPAGIFASVETIKHAFREKEMHKLGGIIFDTVGMIVGDGLAGNSAGQVFGKKAIAHQEASKASGDKIYKNLGKAKQRNNLANKLDKINKARSDGPLPKATGIKIHQIQQEIGRLSKQLSEKIGPNRVHVLTKDRLGQLAVDTSNHGRLVYTIEGLKENGRLNLKFKEYLPYHNYDNPGCARAVLNESVQVTRPILSNIREKEVKDKEKEKEKRGSL